MALAMDWAAAEGWNPGLADAQAFAAADPEGFRGAERDGELLACISAVRTGEDFGFIGFYIARPPPPLRHEWIYGLTSFELG